VERPNKEENNGKGPTNTQTKTSFEQLERQMKKET